MKIPKNREVLVGQSLRAKAGLAALGTTVGVAQNTETRLTTDIEKLVGVPGSTVNLGAQGEYNKAQQELGEARAARHEARANAHTLCSNAVDALKAHLGRTWNPRWTAAGFGDGSLAIPKAKVPAKLLELRNFFRDNPAREVTSEGLTAAAFQAASLALHAAEQTRDAAIRNFRDARDARNAATSQLKSRLSGLQEELARLLSPADNRWATFGFPRPSDGPLPERVQGVTLTPGLPGTVRVQWDHPPRATHVRVSWKPQDSSDDPIVAGLYSDREATLSELPSGVAIEVYLTARNAAGETQPAKATINSP